MANTQSVPKDILIAQSAAKQINDRNANAAQAEEANIQSQQQTLAGLAALQAVGGMGDSPQSSLQSQVLQALLENLQHDMGKKRAKEAEEEESTRRFMLARTGAIKHEKEQRELSQNYCNHLKENGRSRICGQKLSNNHYSYLCSYCHKEFDETTLPPHLQVAMETIGG